MLGIHPQTYLFIYIHFLLIIVLITIFQLTSGSYKPTNNRLGAFIFALFLVFFIGLRSINGPGVGLYFGDTINYYNSFKYLAEKGDYTYSKDIGFYLFTKFSARVMSAQLYFFILAIFYVVPLYYAIKRFSLKNTFLLFLTVVTSFLFWSSAVNGIRIGIASSLFLLGITYKDKKWVMFLLFAIGISFQKSIVLPMLAFALTFVYNNSKGYIIAWFSSILLSLTMGSFWQYFFASLFPESERLTSFLTTKPDATVFASTGFRWDFLIYSAIPIFLGSYFIYKKRFQNKFYIQLFNTYLLANSFWILVIKSDFSNRFAALSWFMIPLIIMLPLLRIKIWERQTAKIGLILFLNFAFTYYMTFKYLW
jgi:hypothetical protein